MLTHPHYIKMLVHNHNLFLKLNTLSPQFNQHTHLANFLRLDSGLAVLCFKQGDASIDAIAINKIDGRQSSFAAGTLEQGLTSLGEVAQGSSKVLNEEELEFLADPGVAEGPVTQTIITHNVTYQADDLDAYDSDCDDFSTAKAVLLANLSSY
ncbi:hypothetical protein Tco_1546132 [Tanacetum coccineum]